MIAINTRTVREQRAHPDSSRATRPPTMQHNPRTKKTCVAHRGNKWSVQAARSAAIDEETAAQVLSSATSSSSAARSACTLLATLDNEEVVLSAGAASTCESVMDFLSEFDSDGYDESLTTFPVPCVSGHVLRIVVELCERAVSPRGGEEGLFTSDQRPLACKKRTLSQALEDDDGSDDGSVGALLESAGALWDETYEEDYGVYSVAARTTTAFEMAVGLGEDTVLACMRPCLFMGAMHVQRVLAIAMAKRLNGLPAPKLRAALRAPVDMPLVEADAARAEHPFQVLHGSGRSKWGGGPRVDMEDPMGMCSHLACTAPDEPGALPPLHVAAAPSLARSTSGRLGDEDAIEATFCFLDVSTMRELKSVSLVWRDRARKALLLEGSAWRRAHPNAVELFARLRDCPLPAAQEIVFVHDGVVFSDEGGHSPEVQGGYLPM
jgi:hypothetical protein